MKAEGVRRSRLAAIFAQRPRHEAEHATGVVVELVVNRRLVRAVLSTEHRTWPRPLLLRVTPSELARLAGVPAADLAAAPGLMEPRELQLVAECLDGWVVSMAAVGDVRDLAVEVRRVQGGLNLASEERKNAIRAAAPGTVLTPNRRAS